MRLGLRAALLAARAAWEKDTQAREEQRRAEREALERQRAWEKEAYDKVQEIASRAIEGSRRSVVTMPGSVAIATQTEPGEG